MGRAAGARGIFHLPLSKILGDADDEGAMDGEGKAGET